MKARELGRGSVVVGDRVALAGDVSGAAGTLARIVRVEERTSVLRRSPDDTDPLERVIVANADQMVIVCALADPEPKTRFIDRCLVAAYDAGLDPLLVLTKSDLAAPRKLRAFYRPLAIPMLTTRQPLPAADADPAPQGARRPGQRPHRPVRGGEVIAGQRARPGRRPRGRTGQRGDRQGTAHLVVRYRAAPAGRLRLADRHPGSARLRPWPRDRPTGSSRRSATWPREPRTARPGCDHLSARVRPRRVGGRARRHRPP